MFSCNVIDEQWTSFTTPATLPAVPRIERIGWGSVRGSAYRRQTAQRAQRHGAVQITLAGCGYLFDRHGAITAEIPVGRALAFVAPLPQVIYGAHPGAAVPWEFVYVNLGGGAAHAIIAELVAAHGHVLACDPDQAVVRGLRAQVAEGFPVRRIGLAAGAALAGDLLNALVAAQEPDPGADARLVEAAMAWLGARLDRRVGVAEAAAACGVSREHLSRSFTAVCGRPPATWLRSERLHRAGALLRAGDLAIAEIARRCGFSSASAFAAAFRREHGASAGSYRRGRA